MKNIYPNNILATLSFEHSLHIYAHTSALTVTLQRLYIPKTVSTFCHVRFINRVETNRTKITQQQLPLTYSIN